VTLVLGQRMVRLEDGQRGVVAQNGPELRIVYNDRGEERLASKVEKWVVDSLRPGPLRGEEKRRIARYADRALRAYERHEPHRYWEMPGEDPIYDYGLVYVIEKYLTERETMPIDDAPSDSPGLSGNP